MDFPRLLMKVFASNGANMTAADDRFWPSSRSLLGEIVVAGLAARVSGGQLQAENLNAQWTLN